jgi:hypothetical protein
MRHPDRCRGHRPAELTGLIPVGNNDRIDR